MAVGLQVDPFDQQPNDAGLPLPGIVRSTAARTRTGRTRTSLSARCLSVLRAARHCLDDDLRRLQASDRIWSMTMRSISAAGDLPDWAGPRCRRFMDHSG